MKLILALLLTLVASAASADTLCAPINDKTMARTILGAPSSTLYLLDSRGCTDVANATDVAWFKAQGYVSGSSANVAVGTAGQVAWYATSGGTVSGNPGFTVNATGDVTEHSVVIGSLAGPLIGHGASAVTAGSLSGNTTTIATASGTLTSGDCLEADANHNIVDAGGTCTTSGGGGTVAAGSVGELASYTGTTTVSGTTTGTGVLTALGDDTNATGGISTYPVAQSTLSGLGANVSTALGNAINASSGLLTNPVALASRVSGLLPVANGGSGAGTFTSGAPVLGAGTSAMTSGSISGNTTTFVTSSGALTSGHCLEADVSPGNVVDAGGVCTTGGGGGTVAAGTVGQVPVYSGTTTVTGNTTGTGFVTAMGVNVGTAGAVVVNGGALGAPSSGTLTNASGLPIAGIASLGSNVATGMANATNGANGFSQQNSSGYLPFTQVVGSVSGSSAAGNIGQIITSGSLSGVSMSNGSAKTIGSIDLTAGNWEIWASYSAHPAGSTVTQYAGAVVSLTDNVGTAISEDVYQQVVTGSLAGAITGNAVGRTRVSITTPTTYYLVGTFGFSVSTMTASGRISAVRTF